MHVIVDGVSVATVACDRAGFSLKHLAAGQHVLALAPASSVPAGAAVPASIAMRLTNTTFFVAHETFWAGGAASPLQYAAPAADGGGAQQAAACARGGGGRLHFWVIMAAHNAAQWVDKAILSLKQQRYCAFTCVVVDDASSDLTLQVARVCASNIAYSNRGVA